MSELMLQPFGIKRYCFFTKSLKNWMLKNEGFLRLVCHDTYQRRVYIKSQLYLVTKKIYRRAKSWKPTDVVIVFVTAFLRVKCCKQVWNFKTWKRLFIVEAQRRTIWGTYQNIKISRRTKRSDRSHDRMRKLIVER